jgi:DNA primase
VSQGRIPEDVINQVRDRADIETVVSCYLALTRAGQNLKGLCPFHNEKTPSFFVNTAKQLFKCFGCGEGGDVFKFMMKREGMSFQEAVMELGRRVGISIPTADDRTPLSDGAVKKRLQNLNELAATWYQQNLNSSEGTIARNYLEGRGILASTSEAFGVGLALPSWDGLLQRLVRNGYAPKEGVIAGLIVPRDQSGHRYPENGYYDRFRNRLMFPIWDLQKRVVAFGGRHLGEDGPKYLNSSDTPLFRKGHTLYSLERARESASRLQTLIIVEGYFDVIALHQAGITNVAATLGTALTADHIQMISRFVKKVILLFDPDEAGVRASLRTLDLFVGSNLGVKVISLPDGHDPDTFVRKNGAQAFLHLQEAAPSLLDFSIQHCLAGATSGSIEDKIRSVDNVLGILQKAGNRIEKEEYTRRVAERLGISQQRLIERYPELTVRQSHRTDLSRAFPPTSDHFKRCAEERDLAYLLIQGLLSASILRNINTEIFSNPVCRRLVEIGMHNLGADGRILVRQALDEALADPICEALALELSMSELHYDDVELYAKGCLDKVQRKHDEAAMGALIMQMKVAEREGRLEEVRALNQEINRLRLKKAGVPSVQTA